MSTEDDDEQHAKRETEKFRSYFERNGWKHAPEYETDDFIFPRSAQLTPQEMAEADVKRRAREKLHRHSKLSQCDPPGLTYNFAHLLPRTRDALHREEEPFDVNRLKIKEDYYHLLNGETHRTLCGIDTLSALFKDEGGQWRDVNADPEKFRGQTCPRCKEIHDAPSAGDSKVPLW